MQALLTLADYLFKNKVLKTIFITKATFFLKEEINILSYLKTLTLSLTLKQSRKLDVYFEYEEKIMSKSTLDKSLLDMISDPDGEYFKSELGIKFKLHNKSIPVWTSDW